MRHATVQYPFQSRVKWTIICKMEELIPSRSKDRFPIWERGGRRLLPKIVAAKSSLPRIGAFKMSVKRVNVA